MDFYAIIAPKWRAMGRPAPMLNKRRLIRWEVVREIRPTVHADGIISSGIEHVGWFWTYAKARRAADRLQGVA